MMKRILFVISNLGCGGINRSLENLLSVINNENLRVSVLAFDTTGQYKDGFAGSSLLRPNLFVNYLTRALSEQRGFAKWLTALIKTIDRISGGRVKQEALSQQRSRILKENYDAIIAFSEGAPTHFLSPVNNRNKIAWIHCDYKSYLTFCKEREDQEINTYANYDKIICVSDFTKNSFKDVSKNCSGQILSIPNVLNTSLMKESAVKFKPDYDGDFNIITVGRIDPIKRPSVIPEILSCILRKIKNVHWYIIGPTIWQSELDKLLYEIKKYDVEDNIHLLGQKDNPYPYIKNANLLVNTSVSEACPYVVNEAKVLGIPVVCTDFGSAKQFIRNGIDGFSVPLEKMADTITKLIINTQSYNSIKENLVDFEYDNKSIKEQFLNLI